MAITVSLRIVGVHLNPNEISSILLVAPHSTKRKGDVQIITSKKEIVSKFGVWHWKSTDLSELLTLDDHFDHIKETFGHAYSLFSMLPNVDDAWLDVCLLDKDVEGGDSSLNFVLSKKSLRVIGDIGLPIEFTIYQPEQ